MNALERRIADNLERAGIRPGDSLVLACSGGVDSVVLAHVLSRLVPPASLTLAHADHGLRGAESDGDEVFVRALAESYDMAYESARLPVTAYAAESGRSLEEAGRILRYEWLERVRADTGAVAVLVAHHADDLAETMLYRLARGSGIRGLRALSLRRGDIVRPMLDVDRSEIEAYAREHALGHREDATNADTAILRNLLRHEVMPHLERINPEYRRAFERFSRYAADCADYLDERVREWLGDADYFSLSAFRAESDFLRREIVRYLYESAQGSTVGLSEANI